jgi:hypothetical protein
VKGDALIDRIMLEQAVLYDKYSIDTVGRLMNFYFNSSADYYAARIIELSEYFLAKNDIDKILTARHPGASITKTQVKVILIMSLVTYSITGNRAGFNNIEALLGNYYRGDNEVRRYVEDYRYF